VSGATRYDPETIHGFDNRRNNWEVSATLSRELMSRVSADVSYFRRAQGHFTTTDNLDVAPSDFTPYCVTAPRDSRLPDGGGFQVCGLVRHCRPEIWCRDQQHRHLRRELQQQAD
jgi:hypothetical protein